MALNENYNPEFENQIWKDLLIQFPDEKIREANVAKQFLDEAEKIYLDKLSNPFGQTLSLTFDSGKIFLKLLPWHKTDTTINPNRPILAKVNAISENINNFEDKKAIQHILLEGPSIYGIQDPKYSTAIAKHCSISYRTISMHFIDYGFHTKGHRPSLKEQAREAERVQALREQGMILQHPAGEVEMIPSLDVYEMPGVVKDLFIPNKYDAPICFKDE